MTRLLICLPYWNGDRIQMERVADLAADLLEKTTAEADLLFVGRYDADHPSPEIVRHVREKFRRVSYWRCTRDGEGFPEGCNNLAYGLFQYLLDERRVNGNLLDIDAMLMLEADCVLTRPSWLKDLIIEWEGAKACGKYVAGAVQPAGRWNPGSTVHVNAAALYHPELLLYHKCLVGGPREIGWDYYHGRQMVPVTHDSALFKLDYQKKTITPEELFSDQRIVVYHGVKDDSAIRAVRKRWGI